MEGAVHRSSDCQSRWDFEFVISKICFSKQFFSNKNCFFFSICFLETFTGDDDGDEEDGERNPDDEPPTPSCMDYIMHFLTLFWKLLFAFIPPTGNNSYLI